MRPPNTKGISPRALEKVGPDTKYPGFYAMLRRVTPQRQEQIAEMMSMSADRTLSFLNLLIAASKDTDFVGKKWRTRGISRAEQAELVRTIQPLEELFRLSAPAFPGNAYVLAVTEAYLRRILRNDRVASYLCSVHPEILQELAADGLVTQAPGDARRGGG